MFKIRKADIWAYRDAASVAPARAGSIQALRELTFPDRVKALADEPEKYKALNPNSVGDRLRHIGAVFQLAVDRGHLENNPAIGVSEFQRRSGTYRVAYSVGELQTIFSNKPFDKKLPIAEQTDEFWVPLLALFLGGRLSELYLRMEDVYEDAEIPYVALRESEERGLKTPPQRVRFLFIFN